MGQLSFIVPGEPTGKARARSFIQWKGRRPKLGDRLVSMPFIKHYTPGETTNYEARVALMFKRAAKNMPTIPRGVPVTVDAVAYFGMAKSWSKRKYEATNGKPCLKKCDADNHLKALLDGLNGVAYHDDAQVTEITISKVWATNARTEISISWDTGELLLALANE